MQLTNMFAEGGLLLDDLYEGHLLLVGLMIKWHPLPTHKIGCRPSLGLKVASVVRAEIDGVVELGNLCYVSRVMIDVVNEHTLTSSR
jgi:hypothetical protein